MLAYYRVCGIWCRPGIRQKQVLGEKILIEICPEVGSLCVAECGRGFGQVPTVLSAPIT